MQQKKSVYVFGSSTPRELSYLDTAKSSSPSSSANNSANVTNRDLKARTPSRIVPAKSVFGRLPSNGVSHKNREISSLFSSRNASDSGGSSNGVFLNGMTAKGRSKGNTASLMTQSLYEPKLTSQQKGQ